MDGPQITDAAPTWGTALELFPPMADELLVVSTL